MYLTPAQIKGKINSLAKSNAWNEEEYEAFRLLNSSLTNISIYTYDMVLRRAIKMNEYLINTHKK